MTTIDFLAVASGVLLSLLFSYFPGAADWYAALDGVYKRLVMLGLLVLLVAVVIVAACTGWAPDLGLADATCDRTGIVQVAMAFLLAVIGNQSAYLISPQQQRRPTTTYPEPDQYPD